MWRVIGILVFLTVSGRLGLPYDYYGMFLERLVSQRILAEVNGIQSTIPTLHRTTAIVGPSTTSARPFPKLHSGEPSRLTWFLGRSIFSS